MNEHVSRAHPDFGADFRAFDAQLTAAPLLVLASPSSAGDASPAPCKASTALPTQGEAPGRPTDPYIAHAARRGRVGLWDRREATLIAAKGRLGSNKALVEFDDGTKKFVAISLIAALIGAPE